MAISFSNINSSVRASNVFIEMEGVSSSVGGDYIPPIGLIMGQYDQSKTSVVDNVPVQVFTADQVGELAGFGSEAHRQAIWIFGLLGGFYENMWWAPIAEPDSAGAATGTLVFGSGPATSTGTYNISICGDVYSLPVAVGDTATSLGDDLVTAITADINSAVTAINTAGSVAITAKTKGTNGNEISVILNPAGDSDQLLNPSGLTVTEPATGYLTGGTGVCDVETALANMGDRWYTHVTGPYNDATNIGFYKAAGDARFDPGVNRLFATYIAYVQKTYSEAYAIPATINSEWIAPSWEPRSYSPHWELQAAVMGLAMASMALDPGRPYKTLSTGIPVNTATANLTYAENDALFRAGMGYFKTDSTGDLLVGDLALSYRTNSSGAAASDWYDLVSLHLRQQKAYNLENLFLGSPYDRGMVADNTTITAKNYVIKPAKVVTDLFSMIDFWNSEGWTKNPDTVKATISAEINSSNNSRIDAELTDDPAQALRIIATKFNFLY
jgi:phage tail sheath gpL-like